MGEVLGNTMGDNTTIVKYFAQWLRDLPKEYASKKFIFFGYSKGASIAHHMLAEQKDIRDRTRYIVTLGGVVQGAIPAKAALSSVEKLIDKSPTEIANDLKNPKEFMKGLKSALGSAAAELLKSDLVKDLMSVIGININNVFDDYVKQFQLAHGVEYYVTELEIGKTPSGWRPQDVKETIKDFRLYFPRRKETKEVKRVVGGTDAMTAKSRIIWNLNNLAPISDGLANSNNRNNVPVAIFNISSLTDIKDLLLPEDVADQYPLHPPTFVPQLSNTGVVWEDFSLDNVFLHATSIEGFQMAPGGLFDTQVAWLDTKSMPLDMRPLTESLDEKELSELKYANHLNTGFINRTFARNIFFSDEDLKGLSFIDLGEMRATHWDIAFRQVYRADKAINPGGADFIHRLPRMAMYAAILETLAIYKIMDGELNIDVEVKNVAK